MPKIEWSESLSVGIEEIDLQHRKIFDLIVSLGDAIRRGDSQSKLEEIIYQMIDYSSYHFETEESYFKKFVFPGQGAHVREHNLFVDEVKTYRTRLERGEKGLAVEIFDFLSGWISQHVQGMDQRYAPFLRYHIMKKAS